MKIGVSFDFQVIGVKGPENGWLWKVRGSSEMNKWLDPVEVVEGKAREITAQVSVPDSSEVVRQWWSALSHYFASEEGKTLVASVELLGALTVLTAIVVR